MAATIVCAFASAQISITPKGTAVVGTRQVHYSMVGIDSINGEGLQTFGSMSGVATFPLVAVDTLAAMNVLGVHRNNSGGYITFGNQRHVSVGEWAGKSDSDVLLLRGKEGIRYENGQAEIFRYPYNGDKFAFACDIITNRVLLNSDARLKSGVEEIGGTGKGLSSITPVSYTLSAQAFPAKAASSDAEGEERILPPAAPSPGTHFGFIAQEVKDIYPELVVEGEDGYLSVDYIGFIPMLVSAVQEMDAKIKEQEAVIESLTARENAPQRAPGKDGGQAGIDGPAVVRPSLAQNRPNPFTATTVIECTLPESVADASLHIYDLQGKQVMKLAVEGRGSTSVTVDGSTLAAGMYIYALIADGREIDSKRMILTD